jgi:hypothetical protein
MYRNGEKPIPVGIANIAAETNLYTFIDKRTGEKTKEIEDLFCQLEGNTAPILARIAAEKSLELTDEERRTLAEFVAFLIVRGPSYSDKLKNMEAELFKIHMKGIAEDSDQLRAEFAKAGVVFGNDKEFEDARQAILDFDNHMKIEMRGGKAGLFKRAAKSAEHLLPYLYAKSWHLLVATEGRVFVTSDNPVFLHKSSLLPPHLGSGYAHGTVFLTISPDTCLVLRNEPLDREVIRVASKWVDKLNRSILKATHRQVYANLESQDIRRAYDRFAAGVESQIKTIPIKNTPYLFTKGMELDDELSLLRHYAHSQ